MEEVTIADYEAKKAELESMKQELIVQGKQIIDPATGKPLIKSKMFWLNMLAIGGVAAGLFGYQLQWDQALALVGIPMLNIVLRYLNKDISGIVN